MKKLLLSLGTLAAASAPALTVVACAQPSISDEQQKQIDRLTSAQAINKLERVWLEELILLHMEQDEDGPWMDVVKQTDGSYTYNGEDLLTETKDINKEVLAKIPHVQKAFKWFMEEQLISNSTYLTSVKEALDEEPEFNEAYEFPVDENGDIIVNEVIGYASNFDALGFNADYINKTWFNEVIDIDGGASTIEIHTEFSEGSTDFGDYVDATATHPATIAGTADALHKTLVLDTTAKATEFVMSTLFDKDVLGLVNELFRMFLMEEYMSISRDEWNEVFGEEYRENNSNITGTAEWETLHLLIQEESDFPLIKFGLDQKPFMSWSVTVEGDDALKYAGAGEIATAADADGHFLVSSPDIPHANGNYESIAAGQSYKTNFARINEFGIGGGDIASAINPEDIGYQGVSAMISQGQGNLKMDSQSSLRLAIESDYYNGYMDNEESVLVTEEIDFKDDAGMITLQKYVSLMPLYDEESLIPSENDPSATKNRLTYDPIQHYDADGNTDGAPEPLSQWSEDKDLLAWYFYQMSPTDTWNEAKEYFISENGLDVRLGITSQFVYDVYMDLGIDYIEKV